MELITIQVKDKQRKRFLLQLLAELNFVDILPNASNLTAEERRFVANLRASLQDVALHREGKIQLKTAQQLMANAL